MSVESFDSRDNRLWNAVQREDVEDNLSNAFLKSTKQIVKSLYSLFISSIIRRRANICEIVDRPPLKPFWLLRSSGSTAGTRRFSRSLL